ncbi:lysophospholipid acyltransferase [Apophysomyces sp. BC1015]|nr:lysophospholipid acyltransferase [Apophysomyces sp. BC1015]KAG0180692.1 lysophospholipid acyltransferase [Apophysomyces sp. BC1021]
MRFYRHPNGPWINFAMVLASMSLCHIDRLRLGTMGDTSLDYSGTLMIATIKLSSFGFNVMDGRRDTSELTPYNKKMKILQYPTLTEFFGWMFFFGGVLVGPTCEYMDYIRFTYGRPLSPSTEKHVRQPSSTWKPTIRLLGQSLLFIIILVTYSPKYDAMAVLEPSWKSLSFYQRLWFLQMAAFTARCKYYAVWLMAEGACVLCGFGFNGYDSKGEARWDRLSNIRVVSCETAQSLKQLGEAWNIGANRWLRHYVYLRVTPPNKKAGSKSAFLTYAVSATWHGFYPGYYIMFLSISFFQVLARKIRRSVRPLMLTPDMKSSVGIRKFVYDLAGWVATMGLINILSMSFILLHISPTVQAWSGIYFAHYWIGLLLFGFWKVSHRHLVRWQKNRAAGWPSPPRVETPMISEMAVEPATNSGTPSNSLKVE